MHVSNYYGVLSPDQTIQDIKRNLPISSSPPSIMAHMGSSGHLPSLVEVCIYHSINSRLHYKRNMQETNQLHCTTYLMVMSTINEQTQPIHINTIEKQIKIRTILHILFYKEKQQSLMIIVMG